MTKIELVPHIIPEGNGDILWDSGGEFKLEIYQCGNHPSICSVEKDPRILNTKHELTLLILDSLKELRLSTYFF